MNYHERNRIIRKYGEASRDEDYYRRLDSILASFIPINTAEEEDNDGDKEQ